MSSWVWRDLDSLVHILADIKEQQDVAKRHDALKLALKLMRVAPLATTDVVLELVAHAITGLVASQRNRQQSNASEDKLVSLTCDVIRELRTQLISSPEKRASLFGPWSLRLLAETSSFLSSFLLDSLISLASDCFAVQSDLINLLLELSAQQGPSFDWVVGQVASSASFDIVSRVLDVGLNDFVELAKKKKGKEWQALEKRLECIVAIMNGDLDLNHREDVLDAVRLKLKLAGSKDDVKAKFVLPFLMKLATISIKGRSEDETDTLLTALTNDLALMSATEVEEMFDQALFDESHFRKEEDQQLSPLLASGVTLVMRCEKAYDVLRLLLNVGKNASKSGHVAGAVIDQIVLKLTRIVHQGQENNHNRFLVRLCPYVDEITSEFLFSESAFIRSNAVSLLALLVLQKGGIGSIFSNVLVMALKKKELDKNVLLSMVEYIRRVQLWREVSMEVVIERGLSLPQEERIYFLQNWLSLSKFPEESSTSLQFRDLISRHYIALANLLKVGQQEQLILELLIISGDLSTVDMCTGYKLCYALIDSIFRCIGCDRNPRTLKRCVRVLTKLSNASLLPVMQRLMLQGALDSEYAFLFGAKNANGSSTKERKRKEEVGSKCLLDENYKFSTMPTQPMLGATTAFHAGVIGPRGRLSKVAVKLVDEKTAEMNRFVFVTVLFRLCSGQIVGKNKLMGRERAKEACKLLALTLVEMVTPDVMYNGLPWPEEEFTKVTMERDLGIFRYFDSHPVLWPIMQGLAEARPALCYTSVLLRAILAVQMNFWSSCIAHKAKEYPKHLKITCDVLELMAIGQFVPEPLDKLSLVVDVLSAFHLHCVLLDVWNFMRDHVPSPVAYASNAQGALHRHFDDFSNYRQYYERLRLIMLHHVADFPQVVKCFFIDNARCNRGNEEQRNGDT